MNKFWIYVLAVVLFVACNAEKAVDEKVDSSANSLKVVAQVDSGQVVDTILLAKTDTAFLVKHQPIKDDIGDLQKDYNIRIYFSNPSWPMLAFEKAIGAELYLTGDLNGDQLPELLLKPDWFSSCWTTVNLFSLKANQWKLVKSGSMYFCADKYPLTKRIIKTAAGYGLLTDSLTANQFITLKKEIKF